MAFSTVCEYAIRALTRMALAEPGRPIKAREIAASENIPRHFLAKILHQLTQKGFVHPTRGPGGGYVLTRPPEEIGVMEVIESIDGPDSLQRRCVLGLDDCNDEQPCPVHDFCKGFKGRFIAQVAALDFRTMGRILERKRAAAAGRAGRPPRSRPDP